MAEDNQGHNHSGAFSGMHSHDGGALHWHDEFGEHYSEDMPAEEVAARQLDWKKHHLVLVTVGMDVGSSTTHLMFSRLFLQLVGEAPAVHTVVVGREILWQSPIMFTPYLDDGLIDARALRRFVASAYNEVNATAAEVDTGAIVLTGEALKRENARSIAELFAAESGKFVRASAGHHMEAVLAANGSGTVSRSRRDQRLLLNVDIGGGTTKFAIVRDGEILSTAAVAIGARQIVKDREGRLIRIDEPALITAKHLGVDLQLGQRLDSAAERRLVDAWAEVLAGLIRLEAPQGLGAELMLTEPLSDSVRPQAINFSGGVSEYIFYREDRDFADLGKALGQAIRNALSNGSITLPAIVDPNLGIRATAVGASMFTSQAGINAYVSDDSALPLLNVPVLMPRIQLDFENEPSDIAAAIASALDRADLVDGEQSMALAFRSPELDDPTPELIAAVAQGIRAALARTLDARLPVVILSSQALAHDVGVALKKDLGIPGDVVAMEQVTVADMDFIDLAEVVHPTEAIPLVVKSLLFAGGLDRRSVKMALLDAAQKAASEQNPAVERAPPRPDR